ncbi:MAG: extracellular catalytic domain type 1 short-chain-length polyhydroxyalkanoate depolymerase [Ktedonobacteraceae bacterium]
MQAFSTPEMPVVWSSMPQEYNYRDAAGNHPYFVHTPKSYQVGIPVPLIVMLHGCTQTALDFAAGTRMNLLAEQHNFIVVYPQQTTSSNRNLCWNWFLPTNQVRGSGEPACIAGIVQTIKNATMKWTIDPTRIYVAGISAGAALAVILGVTYPDLFAAIGVHSGLEYQAATSTNTAFKVMRRGGPEPGQQGLIAYHMMSNHARLIPTIVFHGTNDQFVVPLNGDQTVQQWIQTNTLASQGSYTADFIQPDKVTYDQVPGGRTYTTTSWHNADGEEVQVYWKISGMGHAWSGGNAGSTYTDRKGPDASLAIYTFFMAHPLKSRETPKSHTAPSQKKLPQILTDLISFRKGKQNS